MRLAPPGANPPRAAFTLLELLAVIAIVAILAGLMIGAGRRAVEAGRMSRARAELAVVAAALENYRRVHGDYPRTDDPAQLLQALDGRRDPNGAEISGRALLETARFTLDATQLVDPWGQPYRYAYKSTIPWLNPDYVLYSAGPDGSDFSRLLAGGFVDPTGSGNADNLHANR